MVEDNLARHTLPYHSFHYFSGDGIKRLSRKFLKVFKCYLLVSLNEEKKSWENSRAHKKESGLGKFDTHNDVLDVRGTEESRENPS